MCTCNLRTGDGKTGGSLGPAGHQSSWLHASWFSERPCLKEGKEWLRKQLTSISVPHPRTQEHMQSSLPFCSGVTMVLGSFNLHRLNHTCSSRDKENRGGRNNFKMRGQLFFGHDCESYSENEKRSLRPGISGCVALGISDLNHFFRACSEERKSILAVEEKGDEPLRHDRISHLHLEDSLFFCDVFSRYSLGSHLWYIHLVWVPAI